MTLGLMTKYWDTGRVKTRLGAAIGMGRASALHKLFVSHLCASLAMVAEENIACLAPDERLVQFEQALESWDLKERWKVVAQGEGDLGNRIERWFARHLREKAILVGADCPTIEPDTILQAADLLRTRDVVLGPAADGGYYLIGLRGPWTSHRREYEPMFRDMPWSTEQVLTMTRERAQSAGLTCGELEVREDVDTIVELNHVRESLPVAGPRYDELSAEIERIMGDRFQSPDTPTPGPAT